MRAAAFRMDGQTHTATSTLMSYEHAEIVVLEPLLITLLYATAVTF